MSMTTTTVQVTVRYFAAARAAAGAEVETVSLERGTTVAELVAQLGGRNEELARVLKRCSFLCDGIDVLPPFAGG
jgi:sulfur-carrier protein